MKTCTNSDTKRIAIHRTQRRVILKLRDALCIFFW